MYSSMRNTLAALWFAATASAAGAAGFDRLVVFGDSLSDGGNAYAVTQAAGGAFPPSPPYNQRATNGLTAVEQFAQSRGIVLAPSEAGGTNYSYIGALTDRTTANFVGRGHPGEIVTTDNFADVQYGLPALNAGTSLRSQYQTFRGEAPAFDPGRTLYTVWGGPNDLFLALDPLNPGAASAAAQAAVTNILGLVEDLATEAGARHILVANMPDLGATPFGQSLGRAGAAGLTLITGGFNQALAGGLAALENGLRPGIPGIDIQLVDVFSAMALLVAAPPPGFNVNTPCLVTNPDGSLASLCGNPDDYLFWDPVHPTAAGHARIAALFTQAIPEPATYAMLLAGAGLLLVAVRRRRG